TGGFHKCFPPAHWFNVAISTSLPLYSMKIPFVKEIIPFIIKIMGKKGRIADASMLLYYAGRGPFVWGV
ncbi:MAG: hypothetical protein IJN44_02480, partial [Clostridia bacterium]|nr:hypothetical protein [Clostridia bacterium]